MSASFATAAVPKYLAAVNTHAGTVNGSAGAWSLLTCNDYEAETLPRVVATRVTSTKPAARSASVITRERSSKLILIPGVAGRISYEFILQLVHEPSALASNEKKLLKISDEILISPNPD